MLDSLYNFYYNKFMSYDNNDDWDLIREEMEAEALARRIERRTYQNQLFLNLFPKHMRKTILDIETFLVFVPVLGLLLYIFIRLIFHI